MRRMDPPLGKIIHVTCPLVKKEVVQDDTPQGYHYKITALPGSHSIADQIRQFVEFDLSATIFDSFPVAVRAPPSPPVPRLSADTEEEDLPSTPPPALTESIQVSSPSSVQVEIPTPVQPQPVRRSKRKRINLPDSTYPVLNVDHFDTDSNRLVFISNSQ